MPKSWLLIPLLLALALGACQKRDSAAKSPSLSAITAVDVSGSVTLVRPSGDSPLSQGDVIANGDTVRTGKDGSCELDLGDSLVRLLSGTTLQLSSLANGTSQVKLTSGKVLSKVRKLTGRDGFMVRTKSIACGVRGTLFVVEVSPDGAVSVAVLEGSVAVYPDSLIASGTYVPGSADSAAVESAPLVGAGSEVTVPAAAAAAAMALFPEKLPSAEAATALLKAARLLALHPENLSPAALGELEAFRASLPASPSASVPAPSPQSFVLTSAPVPDPSSAPASASNPFQSALSSVPVPDPKPAQLLRSNGVDFSVKDPSIGTLTLAGNRITARILLRPSDVWFIQATFNTPVALVPLAAYSLEFTAWADVPAVISATLMETDADADGDGNRFTGRSPRIQVPLTAESRRWSIPFVVSPDARGPAVANFHLAYDKAVVYLQDVAVKPLDIPSALASGVLFNGDFRYGLSGWNENVFPASRQDMGVEKGVFHFRPIEPVKEMWLAQLGSFCNLPTEKGRRYLLEFDAKAARKSMVETLLVEGQSDTDGDGKAFSLHSPSMVFELLPEWRRYHLEFEATATDSHSVLAFNLGAVAGECWIDNVSLGALPK